MAKADKVIKEEFHLVLNRKEMNALQEICAQWERGDTSTQGMEVAVGPDVPSMQDKEDIANFIKREGKPTRG